ncbi:fibronectin type III domain-containing protein 4 isoform X2 [Alligator sinensis]|uniref:Fibronectin type III domain-containing protein 4 isoform X2 n=1 Tax=Alligator sinensis TaxID=38654 RepID=A0A3Q0FWJ2_ALLSI|nr:fibronectin type III domain-containing protein 4 isoform X2 [Alligator sinensis]
MTPSVPAPGPARSPAWGLAVFAPQVFLMIPNYPHGPFHAGPDLGPGETRGKVNPLPPSVSQNFKVTAGKVRQGNTKACRLLSAPNLNLNPNPGCPKGDHLAGPVLRGQQGQRCACRPRQSLRQPDRPPSPVNVTVTQLKANSATVSWDVPEGDVIIGYAILQQDGQMQRFIREVNTTNRACVLWDLAEDADYVIQVQSIGLHGESQASKRVHFRTLKETDRLPSNSSNQGDITVEGLDKERQLQTGEIVIIVAVLLMWAAVIALFCRQYDIIKDNDSNNAKEKAKPSSEHSTPERPTGGLLRSKKKSPSVNIIEV